MLTFSCSSSTYIPSPLGSPSAARRSVQRLGDRICASPILSRVRRRLGGGGGGGPVIDGQEPIKKSGGGGFCGLFGGGDSEQTNIYLWSGGDTGRIANRHQEDRWDVW